MRVLLTHPTRKRRQRRWSDQRASKRAVSMTANCEKKKSRVQWFGHGFERRVKKSAGFQTGQGSRSFGRACLTWRSSHSSATHTMSTERRNALTGKKIKSPTHTAKMTSGGSRKTNRRWRNAYCLGKEGWPRAWLSALTPLQTCISASDLVWLLQQHQLHIESERGGRQQALPVEWLERIVDV